MKKIRLAIIGQGRSGRDIHAAHLKTDERYQIVAVTDPLEDRRRRAEQELRCKVFADYRELFKLKDLDLIINATPSHLHAPVSLEILKAGFNCLCEKPLAQRVSQVDELIKVSKETGKVLAIFQQARFAPYFQQVQKVIRSGVLGRIVQINIAFNGFSRRWDWQTLRAFGGGSLLNTGPHPLDQALCLFGEGMPEVFCRMDRANTFGDAEDHVKLILVGPGHPIIDIEISSCCAYPCYTYNVYGTRGGLKGDQRQMEWKWFKPEEAAERKLITEPLVGPDGMPAYCSEQLTWHTDSWTLPPEESDLFATISRRFYDMLYAVLTDGAPLEITPEQVRRQIAVIEECQRQNPHIYGSCSCG